MIRKCGGKERVKNDMIKRCMTIKRRGIGNESVCGY